MIEAISSPWPWYVAGPLIGLVVPFVYWYGGKKWGISSSLRHACAAILPAGIEHFRYEWQRRGSWHLAMVGGVLIGGAIGAFVIPDPEAFVAVSEATRIDLAALGLTDFSGLVPAEVFSWGALGTAPGLVLLVGGGFLIGFGARYANGCTSGHAISGLSTLQAGSLVAVVGFFLGGLISTHFLLPMVLG